MTTVALGGRSLRMSIALEAALRLNGEILHAPAGAEEAVMTSVEAGRYCDLNAVASRIWELLETSKTMVQLCEGSRSRRWPASAKC